MTGALDQLVGVRPAAVGRLSRLGGSSRPSGPSRLSQPAQVRLQIVGRDVRQEVDAEHAGGLLAGSPPRTVLAVHQRVLGLGVDDQQRQPGGAQVEGDLLDLAGAAVQLQGVAGAAAQGGGLVHAAGGGSGHLVLRAHAGRHQARATGVVGSLGRAGQPERVDVVQRHRGGALQGGRGGQASAQGHAGDQRGVESRQRAQPVALQGPGHTGDVGVPMADLAGRALGADDVQVQGVDALRRQGGHEPHRPVLAAPKCQVGAMRQGDGQGEPAVVVSVLPDDVDAPRCAPDAVGLGVESLPEQGAGGPGPLLRGQGGGEDGNGAGHRGLLGCAGVAGGPGPRRPMAGRMRAGARRQCARNDSW